MNGKKLTTAILLLIVGFSGGWLVGSRHEGPKSKNEVADASAALEELIQYRGTGARAARKTIELVDRIVAGGEAMVPKLDRALALVSATHRYTSHGDQAPGIMELDMSRGIVSRHTNGTMAILEALDRIGGKDVLPILKREANRQGQTVPSVNRVVAVLFLTHRAGDPEVRRFFNKLVEQYLVTQRDGWEIERALQAVRPYLESSLWDRMSAAFQGGWAKDGLEDEFAETLVHLDERRAAELFLSMLGKETLARPLRSAAARAIARMPEYRAAAEELVLRDPDPFIVNDFVRGLRYGRWGELELYRLALEAADPEKSKAYDLERLPFLKASVVTLRRLVAAVGPEVAEKLSLPTRMREFQEIIDRVEGRYGKQD